MTPFLIIFALWDVLKNKLKRSAAERFPTCRNPLCHVCRVWAAHWGRE
jgi:hypothetical protein